MIENIRLRQNRCVETSVWQQHDSAAPFDLFSLLLSWFQAARWLVGLYGTERLRALESAAESESAQSQRPRRDATVGGAVRRAPPDRQPIRLRRTLSPHPH